MKHYQTDNFTVLQFYTNNSNDILTGITKITINIIKVTMLSKITINIIKVTML